MIIATACNVDPGFKGCITLELVNSGEAPLVLYPGVRIAQLVFHHADGKAKYDEGKYDCQAATASIRPPEDHSV